MHLNTKYFISAIGFEETKDSFFLIIIIFIIFIIVGVPRCFHTSDGFFVMLALSPNHRSPSAICGKIERFLARK